MNELKKLLRRVLSSLLLRLAPQLPGCGGKSVTASSMPRQALRTRCPAPVHAYQQRAEQRHVIPDIQKLTGWQTCVLSGRAPRPSFPWHGDRVAVTERIFSQRFSLSGPAVRPVMWFRALGRAQQRYALPF